MNDYLYSAQKISTPNSMFAALISTHTHAHTFTRTSTKLISPLN